MPENTAITPPASAATKPAPLLDAHCNHWRQHGEELQEACTVYRGQVNRGVTSLYVTSARYGREGGPAFVRLHTHAGAFLSTFRLTPDDADALAQALQQAAAMSREVTQLVEAGACK